MCFAASICNRRNLALASCAVAFPRFFALDTLILVYGTVDEQERGDST
jgi:hypothetical protein